MTLVPFGDHHNVKPWEEGPDYKVEQPCANPECKRWVDHTHHVVRRSFFGKAENWIEYHGFKIGNLVGLCWLCHARVTDNKAEIVWHENRLFYKDVANGIFDVLDPHPPIQIDYVQITEDIKIRHDLTDVEIPPMLSEGEELGSEAGSAHPAVGTYPEASPPSESICPTCDRPLPKPKPETEKVEQKRERRSWTITVPKDKREEGAEVLDTLLEEARKELARAGLQYGEEGSVRYFVLSTALALFVQHAEEIL